MSNKIAEALSKNSRQARKPAEDASQWNLGTIIEYEESSGQVRVMMHRDRGDIDIGYHPILGDEGAIADYFLRFGYPSPGWGCMIFWKGKDIPKRGSTFVHMITNLPLNLENVSKKNPQTNEVVTGPHKIFGGGLTGF